MTSVLVIVIRERVDESVTSAWTRNAYGAGASVGQGQGESENESGSVAKSGKVAGSSTVMADIVPKAAVACFLEGVVG